MAWAVFSAAPSRLHPATRPSEAHNIVWPRLRSFLVTLKLRNPLLSIWYQWRILRCSTFTAAVPLKWRKWLPFCMEKEGGGGTCKSFFFPRALLLCVLYSFSSALLKGYDSGVFAANLVASSVRMCVHACVWPRGFSIAYISV